MGLAAPPSFQDSRSKVKERDPRPDLDFINNSTMPSGQPAASVTSAPAPDAAAAPPAVPARMLVVGPFASEERAREAGAELQRRHYQVKLEKSEGGWQLSTGPFNSEAESSTALQTLKDLGYSARVP